MFSIKCQEIADKNTGVHLAFGDHGKDKSTVWVRITVPSPQPHPLLVSVGEADPVPPKITTVTLHRDGDVINIMPLGAAPPLPPEGKAKFDATLASIAAPLTSDDERGKA